MPEEIEEKNYFFRLSAYQDKLLALYDAQPEFVLPRFRYNEARSFIEGGLHGLQRQPRGPAVGRRDPVGREPGRLRLGRRAHQLPQRAHLRTPGRGSRAAFWPEVRHLLGKDILRFHAVFWPALLLAAGYEVPQQLFVHGYLLLDDQKISKSVGNVIDPLDLVDVYGVDAVRFYVARVAQFGQDGSASVDSLHERYENELGNDLGNLVSRTTAMIARYRDGTLALVPRPDSRVAELTASLADDVAARIDVFDITGALERVWELVRELNRYVVERAPWQVAKDEARAAEVDEILYDLAEGLRIVAVALAAYLPTTAERILAALGQPTELDWAQRPLRPAVRGGRDRPGGAALPAHRDARVGVIDAHAHLDALADRPACSRACAQRRGARGRHDRHRARLGPPALAIASDEPGVVAAIGIHPHDAAGEDASRLDELRDAPRRPEGGRGGGDRPRLLPRLCAARRATRGCSARSWNSPSSSASPS